MDNSTLRGPAASSQQPAASVVSFQPQVHHVPPPRLAFLRQVPHPVNMLSEALGAGCCHACASSRLAPLLSWLQPPCRLLCVHSQAPSCLRKAGCGGEGHGLWSQTVRALISAQEFCCTSAGGDNNSTCLLGFERKDSFSPVSTWRVVSTGFLSPR